MLAVISLFIRNLLIMTVFLWPKWCPGLLEWLPPGIPLVHMLDIIKFLKQLLIWRILQTGFDLYLCRQVHRGTNFFFGQYGWEQKVEKNLAHKTTLAYMHFAFYNLESGQIWSNRLCLNRNLKDLFIFIGYIIDHLLTYPIKW